jgi:hypothetical protein
MLTLSDGVAPNKSKVQQMNVVERQRPWDRHVDCIVYIEHFRAGDRRQLSRLLISFSWDY